MYTIYISIYYIWWDIYIYIIYGGTSEWLREVRKDFTIEIPKPFSLIGLSSSKAWGTHLCSKTPWYSEVQSCFTVMALGHPGILTYYRGLKVPSPQTGSSIALTEMWQLLISSKWIICVFLLALGEMCLWESFQGVFRSALYQIFRSSQQLIHASDLGARVSSLTLLHLQENTVVWPLKRLRSSKLWVQICWPACSGSQGTHISSWKLCVALGGLPKLRQHEAVPGRPLERMHGHLLRS